jgi:THO complex subunit 2
MACHHSCLQLSPNDTEMETIREEYIRSISSGSGPENALSLSMLVDDAPSTSGTSTTGEGDVPAAKPRSPPEQRISLLQALLAIGDIPASQYLLAKFPWVAQRNPQIADLILRIVGNALEPLYRSILPGFESSEEIVDDRLDKDHTRGKEIVPTLWAPCPPETPTKIFRFFYPAWKDDLEVWSSWEDIQKKGMRWLALVRGLGGRANGVMAKICRIGAIHFASLKKEKEVDAGLLHGAKTRVELRSVEVGLVPSSSSSTS